MSKDTEQAQLPTLLRRIEKQTIEVGHRTPTDRELADTVGACRRIEVRLAETRRRWEALVAEMEPVAVHDKSRRVEPHAVHTGRPVAVGKQYELVPQFKNVRTYNVPAILAATAERMDIDVAVAVTALATYGAVKMSVQWTKLQAFCQEVGVPLRVQNDVEVSDIDGTDGAMVGVRRVANGVKRVPLK